MFQKVYFTLCLIIFSLLMTECVKQEYMSLEHAKMLYYNENYLSNVTVAIRRLNRSDHFYYLTIIFQLVKKLDGKHVQHNFYVYKLHSTNVYTNTHIELHIMMCDFIEKHLLFSRPIQEAYARIPEEERPMPILKCPLVSGLYQFKNLAFSSNKFIKEAPIREGRVYYNATDKDMLLASGYIDFRL